ncbi:MAG: hypothetical protein R3F39_11270 [Myxococcota bacterium]
MAVSVWMGGCDSGGTAAPDARDATDVGQVSDTPDSTSDAASDSADTGDTSTVELPPAACTEDADCAAGRGSIPACKTPRCVGGQCELGAAADGTACDDGSDCTTGETCSGGTCGQGSAVGCDDANPCTTDACDPNAGCVHTYNQKPCDDGSACTLEDRCFQGVCGGTALACDDGNPCTDDVCDAESGCAWKPRVGPCEDGNACTAGDTCVAAVCVPGPAPDCGENNPCLDASCDPLTGCVAALVDGDCDDASACTTGDTCIEGKCVGVTLKCDDKNPCTNDFCDKATGCQSAPNTLSCDDGDTCTLKDVCALGACVPGPLDPLCCDVSGDCDDGDPCTDDSCDAGYCAFVPKDCDDGFICTLDLCDGGECSNTPYGPLPSGTVFQDSFEGANATAAWTLTSTNPEVFWQLDTSQKHTGTTSLYCGNLPSYSYDFGATYATAARVIAVPAGEATLEIWLRQDLDESGSCSFDFTEVAIDGVVQKPCFGDTLSVFTKQTFDLSPWSGKSVTVEVRFDTVDAAINDAGGVWIDDLAVVADSPAGCCVADEDCPGVGCEAWICDPEAVICVAQVPEVLCDDQDPCTADACAPGGACVSTPIDGCCPEGEACP